MSFVVSGAGLSWANGTYTGNTSPLGDAPKYHLRVTEFLPREVTLTLFRCQMRSNQKWWFISEADQDQPGTDKDIDYYQHKSTEVDESLPPRKGWCTSKGPDREKRNPPPTLTPKYGEMDEENLETWLKEVSAQRVIKIEPRKSYQLLRRLEYLLIHNPSRFAALVVVRCEKKGVGCVVGRAQGGCETRGGGGEVDERRWRR